MCKKESQGERGLPKKMGAKGGKEGRGDPRGPQGGWEQVWKKKKGGLTHHKGGGVTLCRKTRI